MRRRILKKRPREMSQEKKDIPQKAIKALPMLLEGGGPEDNVKTELDATTGKTN